MLIVEYSRAKNLPLALMLVALTGFSACTSVTGAYFPVRSEAQEVIAKEQSLQIYRLSVDNIREVVAREDALNPVIKRAIAPPPQRAYVYRVGVGDVLKVTLWDNPERVSPEGSQAPDLIVSENGKIFYPYVGELSVRGKSVGEIRAALMEALAGFLQTPQVEVSVVSYNAHTATLVGEVGAPGEYPITNVPFNLLNALNKSGRTERADLSRVIIRRKGTDYVVDLMSFIKDGRARQNPVLLPDDIVIVNPIANGKVFTFGEIGTAEITLGPENTSLTSVIANRGGLDKLRANARGVFVFRPRDWASWKPSDSPPSIAVFQFELDQPAMYVLAQSFEMRGGDVVFVTQDPISRWNETVAKLLSPVVTTLRAQSVATVLSSND